MTHGMEAQELEMTSSSYIRFMHLEEDIHTVFTCKTWLSLVQILTPLVYDGK
jgi:hypothetical protein